MLYIPYVCLYFVSVMIAPTESKHVEYNNRARYTTPKNVHIWISIETEINPGQCSNFKVSRYLYVMCAAAAIFCLQPTAYAFRRTQTVSGQECIYTIVLPSELHLTGLHIITLMTYKLSVFLLCNFPRILGLTNM